MITTRKGGCHLNDLQKLLKFDNSLPYLFIGSGFSRRYLGTPDWLGLLKIFYDKLHPNNPLGFQQLQQSAYQQIKNASNQTPSSNAVNCKIADIIEDEFNLLWYTEPLFKESRELYKDIVSLENTPFKIELAKYFNEALKQPRLLSEELEKLKNISSNSIAGIITTNYDNLIEEYFQFKKYTNQDELLFSANQELCEIYKIHGCSSSPKTIVIDSADYFHISTRRKYLAAKLLTIFVEHPIIFIGYSLTDEDIQAILSDIVDCLNPKQLELLKSRLIFVDWLKDDDSFSYKINETSMIIGAKSLSMKQVMLKDYGVLYELLAQNKSKYPVKILRELKENIYDLVTTNDPTDKLKIMLPIDQLDNYDNVEYVIGVGISHAAELAYGTFSAEEIYRDIVFDDKQFNYDLLVEKTLPPHLSRTCGSMPLFKYLSRYSKDSFPEIYERYLVKLTSVEVFLNNLIKNGQTTQYGETIEEIRTRYDFPKSLYYILRLPLKYYDTASLGKYLADILEEDKNRICSGSSHPNSSDIRRLIKIYDWLCYHEDYEKKQASMQSVPIN